MVSPVGFFCLLEHVCEELSAVSRDEFAWQAMCSTACEVLWQFVSRVTQGEWGTCEGRVTFADVEQSWEVVMLCDAEDV